MIAEYIARSRATPFEWGCCDCCTWPADYVLERRGVDPMADLRGAYATAFGARRFKIEGGGIAHMWRCRLSFLAEGRDVALAEWRGQIVGGLMLDGLLVLKTAKDIMVTRKYVLLQGWAV